MKTTSPRAMRAFDKWGDAASAGFQLVPDLLLKNQAKLELTHTDLVVLLNVLMHWWYEDKRPFPRTTTIAARMDVQTRTIQRSLSRLEELGLMKRTTEVLPDGDEREVCDPSGLQKRLNDLLRDDPAFRLRTHDRAETSDAF